jgi:hypothetical protein
MTLRYADADHTIIDAGDGRFIPVDLDNADYRALSGPISDYVPPAPTVPEAVTPRQIRLALYQSGLLPAATTWIGSADEGTRIEWDYATEVRRDHAMWPVAAAALGKTSADIDALFLLAATL